MKALVTGGSGFIGGAVVRLLEYEGHDALVTDVEYPLYETSSEYFRVDIREPIKLCAVGFDVVYHCAGLLGTEALIHKAVDAVEVNILGTLNVLEWAVKGNVSVIQPGLVDNWYNSYMITKHCAEDFGVMYHQEFGLDYHCVRLRHVYGQFQSVKQQKIIPSFIMSALYNSPIYIYGEGSWNVNLTYVDDAARCLIDTYSDDAPAVFEFADPGNDMTVLQVAKYIIELCNSASKICFIGMRPGQPEEASDIPHDVLRHTVDFKPLKEGMLETIDWYRSRLLCK